MSTAATESFQYECPHCHKHVGVQEHSLGETIDCPLCKKPFYVQAPTGHRVTGASTRGPEARPTHSLDAERVIHPVLFRRHFFGTLICAALLIVGLAGVGLGFVGAEVLGIAGVALIIAAVCIIVIPAFLLLKWYITSRMQSLTVTSERLTYRYGLIHRGTSEIRHEDVRNMKINQNLFERMLHFGDMEISSSGQDGMEIVIHDIPNPEEVADYIRQRQ